MLERLLTRLHFHLLKLYPDRFLNEFGAEMGDVFAQALSDLDDCGTQPSTRGMKMVRLFFREVTSFPLAYLDARRYHLSLGPDDAQPGKTSFGVEDTPMTWVGRRAPWREAFIGALPFLLFGIAYLLEGIAELGGHYGPVLNLLDGSLLDGPPNRPAIILTAPMGVYLVSVVGLLFGVLRGFPRWSFAYLGMAIFFGWYYSNGRFYNVVYGSWAWLPLFIAVVLGLVLTRSRKPVARLLQGAWYDWTRLSFALYAFAVPLFTVIFFDDDWGLFQLYGLLFDTVLLAAVAVVFLRVRTSWGRMVSLETAVLILMVKGVFLGGWFGGFQHALERNLFISIIIYYFGFLLLPAAIGLLRRGISALSAR